jgi:hypothetical protein
MTQNQALVMLADLIDMCSPGQRVELMELGADFDDGELDFISRMLREKHYYGHPFTRAEKARIEAIHAKRDLGPG